MSFMKYRPCASAYVTSPFGMRNHPVTGSKKMHNGIDLAPSKKVQEPIFACEGGKVILAGAYGTAGNAVKIDHGEYITDHYHLSKVRVKNGEVVKAGQILGNMGTSGSSTGEHLHFGIMKKKGYTYVNPAPFLTGLKVPPANPTEAKVKPPAKAPAPDAGASYTVKKGDTLSAIAKKFKTTVAALVKINSIKDPNKISTGQKIRIK